MARREIRGEMHRIARKRRRFGYRRVGIMLERKGTAMNGIAAREANDPRDRLQGGGLYRIDREEGLSVRRRHGRKRARGSRTPMLVPLPPNRPWSLDPRHSHPDRRRADGSMSDISGACRRSTSWS